VNGDRQRRPALEIERLVLSVDRLREPLVEERARAPDRGDVDRQEGPIEDEDLGVQYGDGGEEGPPEGNWRDA
jgi:hypothetical protein